MNWERDVERILAMEEIPEPMREEMRRFRDYLKVKGRAVRTWLVYLQRLRKLALFLKDRGLRSFMEADRDLLIEFLANMKSEKLDWVLGEDGKKRRIYRPVEPTKSTKRLMIETLRHFYRFLHGLPKGQYPELVRGLEAPSCDIVKVTPSDLLNPEEIRRLIAVCGRPRDKALIALLYEGAFRVSELLNLKLRNVEKVDYGFRVVIEKSKTDKRIIPLVNSAPYLAEWLSEHPRIDDPDAPLFVALGKNTYGKPLTYSGVKTVLKSAARKAKIKKKVHPHILRHTRLTHLARSVKEASLRIFAGWRPGSRMPKIYVHLTGEEVEEDILAAEGVLTKRVVEPLLRKRRCWRCGAENPPHLAYCRECGARISLEPLIVEAEVQAPRLMDEVERLKREIEELKGFIKDLLLQGRHPLETHDLLRFYEESKKAKGLIDLKME